MKAFVSWSGGKESSLAFLHLKKKMQISCILNMTIEDKSRSRSHAIEVELMRLQAQALGVPIFFKSSSWASYEKVFKQAIIKLKASGIECGVFGDVDLQVHRDWVEMVCKDTGIEACLPLWGQNTELLVSEFVDAGFKAVIVCVRSANLGKEWLGRTIDHDFIAQIKKMGNVDVAGERGEYHTFVYDGPIFQNPVSFTKANIIDKGTHMFLELNAGK